MLCKAVLGQVGTLVIYFPDLRYLCAYYFHPGANSRTVTFSTHKFYFEPVIFIPAVISQQHPIAAIAYYKHINITIIIIIAKSSPPAYIFMR